MKKILDKVLNRVVIVGILIFLQVAFFAFEIIKLSRYMVSISVALTILSVLVVFYIVSLPGNPTVKIAWIVPIMLFPMLGGVMYLMFGHVYLPKRFKRNIAKMNELTKGLVEQEEAVWEEVKQKDARVANMSRYLYTFADAPVWKNTKTEYYKVGEEYWEALLRELKKAEKFIFMEYFIVEEGKMWDSIHEILKQKAKEGVEVRFMYDDMECSFLLPNKYYERLEKEGIKSHAFNKMIPLVDLILNNRDHRKITVIDGKTAFTGGINLADEYVNEKSRFGHWKDTGISIKGDAVWNFTVMYLQMWNLEEFKDSDILKYRFFYPADTFTDGYVQPYGDTPLDKEVTGENTYMNIINNAKQYVYIYTPYLIVDNEMITTLTLAAKRGIDVRLVTPGIPDKKIIFWLTQSYYKTLIKAGVRIFQYTPGFIHAKCFLSDDEIATVGTINLDYRSLYHHFECGVFMYGSSALTALKKDMEEVFSVSGEITEGWVQHKKMHMNVIGPVLKLFAPLM